MGLNHFLLPVNCTIQFPSKSDAVIPLVSSHSNVSIIVRLPSFKYKILEAIAKPMAALFNLLLSPKAYQELSALCSFAPLPSSELAIGDSYKHLRYSFLNTKISMIVHSLGAIQHH